VIAHAKVAKDAKVALLRSVSAGSLSFGGFESENVKKLKMTEPFWGLSGLILDDGISGTRADSMDPG